MSKSAAGWREDGSASRTKDEAMSHEGGVRDRQSICRTEGGTYRYRQSGPPPQQQRFEAARDAEERPPLLLPACVDRGV
jgi:hypothetical protein